MAPGSTLADLVAALGLERRRVAVAVNRDVVSRRSFGEHRLATGDRIEILEAVGEAETCLTALRWGRGASARA
jgi:thiamine biosynthesis protein ThiS